MSKSKKRKKQLMTPVPAGAPGEGDEERELEEEDLEFLREGLQEGRLDFLAKLTPKDLESKGDRKRKKPPDSESEDVGASSCRKRRRPRDRGREGEEEEKEFESFPRHPQWGDDEQGLHYLLPLKTRQGLVHQPAILKPTVEEEGESGDDAEAGGSGGEEENQDQQEEEAPPPLLTTAALFAQRQQQLAEKKEHIAELASLLVENPEENILHLRTLRALCVERDPKVAISVRKLAMLSLVAVFKDISPSYHIRELTEAEKAVKVSKDVRRIRHFEQTLLQNYQQFLTLLEETVRVGLGKASSSNGGLGRRRKRRRRKEEEEMSLSMLEGGQELPLTTMEGLAEVALQCQCELLVALPHFNYRSNILAVLVPRMNSKALGGKVSRLCCETVGQLFQNDLVGEVSLEAVQLIAKMVKAQSYRSKPAVLRTFFRLQLHHVVEPVGVGPSGWGKEEMREMKERKAKMSRRQRKRLKAEAQLDQELRETEAEESKERKTSLQTEIMKMVFLTYFRILKHTRHSPLLGPVLEGLAKFAHLINIDFFSDLMSVLHTLAETGGLSNRECMQCVLTAFQILSGQGAALNIDPRQFYSQLYGAILQLDTYSSSEDVVLAVECLDRMVRKRRQVSLQRVFGFVKRLSTVSLQLVPGACLAVMATIRHFMSAYSQCEQLLDVESVGRGVFKPDVPDPEMSQASSTVLWELTLFRTHYAPSLRTYANHLLAGAPSQGRGALHPDLARKTPRELLVEFSDTRVIPMTDVPPPPPHPALRMAKKKKSKREPSEFYYSDPGIMSSAIQHSEKLALELASRTLLKLQLDT